MKLEEHTFYNGFDKFCGDKHNTLLNKYIDMRERELKNLYKFKEMDLWKFDEGDFIYFKNDKNKTVPGIIKECNWHWEDQENIKFCDVDLDKLVIWYTVIDQNGKEFEPCEKDVIDYSKKSKLLFKKGTKNDKK